MYIHIYIYMYVCIHVCIYTYIYTHIRIHVYSCLYFYTYIHMYLCICVSILICYAYLYVHSFAYSLMSAVRAAPGPAAASGPVPPLPRPRGGSQRSARASQPRDGPNPRGDQGEASINRERQTDPNILWSFLQGPQLLETPRKTRAAGRSCSSCFVRKLTWPAVGGGLGGSAQGEPALQIGVEHLGHGQTRYARPRSPSVRTLCNPHVILLKGVLAMAHLENPRMEVATDYQCYSVSTFLTRGTNG